MPQLPMSMAVTDEAVWSSLLVHVCQVEKELQAFPVIHIEMKGVLGKRMMFLLRGLRCNETPPESRAGELWACFQIFFSNAHEHAIVAKLRDGAAVENLIVVVANNHTSVGSRKHTI